MTGQDITSHTKAQRPARRIPLSIGYHPLGLIGMSLIGILIILGDLFFTTTTLDDYAIPMIIIITLMLVQLALDVTHVEEEYLIRTTLPSPGFTFGQVIRLKWPAMMVFVVIFLLGPIKVGGLFLFCMIFSYPYQRKFYLRSHEEFGNQPQEKKHG